MMGVEVELAYQFLKSMRNVVDLSRGKSDSSQGIQMDDSRDWDCTVSLARHTSDLGVVESLPPTPSCD